MVNKGSTHAGAHRVDDCSSAQYNSHLKETGALTLLASEAAVTNICDPGVYSYTCCMSLYIDTCIHNVVYIRDNNIICIESKISDSKDTYSCIPPKNILLINTRGSQLKTELSS